MGNAWMKHLDKTVLSINKQGNVQYTSKNYVDNRMTTHYVYSWNLSDIKEQSIIEFEYSSCKIIRFVCNENTKCINSVQYKNRTKYLTLNMSSVRVYFSDTDTANLAKQKIYDLGYIKASDDDLGDAQVELGISYYYGINRKKDYEKAVSEFEKALWKGNVRAVYYLGLAHYEGKGVKRDIEKAKELLTLAADDGGDPDAKKLLSKITAVP